MLIENVLATFEMEEILYELRDHSAGLNCGIWDYSASFVNKFGESTHSAISLNPIRASEKLKCTVRMRVHIIVMMDCIHYYNNQIVHNKPILFW